MGSPHPLPAAAGVPRRSDPNDAAGIALALGTAVAFGLAIALSRFAYEGGTNGLTLACVRAVVATAVLLVICVASGRRLRVSVRDWLHLSGMGLLISILFYGNVGAVEYIPVGLTALLVFTYPLIIALLDALLERSVPPAAKTVALLIAFLGLWLMLQASFAASDPRGIALALCAGAAAAGNAVWYARRARHLDNLVATLHMTLAAMLAILAVGMVKAEFVLPSGATAWGGFWAVVTLQSLGAPVYFAAIKRIGAVKSGMLSNVQPLTSLVAAYLLFSELLSLLQLLGGALILSGILLMQRHDVATARHAAARAGLRR